MRDPYAVLGVPRGADNRAIKRAYRLLTRRHHPDVNRGRARSDELYREIVEAYTILGDERTRALYDEFGELSLTRGFDPQRARAARGGARDGDGPAGPPWNTARTTAAPDDDDDDPPASDADLDFEDLKHARRTVFEDILSRLWRGRDVQIDDVADADEVDGGMGRDAHAEVSIALARAVVGCTVQVRVGDPSAGGRLVDVPIPAGIEDDSLVLLPGEGEPGRPPGDLHVRVRVLADPALTRRDLDLYLLVPVSLLDLYRGGPLDVATPRGVVSVRIPPACPPDHKLRLRRQGVPGTDGLVGDLYLEFRLQLPPAGDTELLRALERLQAEARP